MAIVLLGFYTIRAFAFGMRFGRQNHAKNHSKTRPGPFKNRCRKHVDFQYGFFENLASIWEGLGSPRWNQVGHVGTPKLLNSSFFTLLSCRSFRNGVLKGSRLDGSEDVSSSTPSSAFPILVEPKHQKKVKNLPKSCRLPARLPRIAKLPYPRGVGLRLLDMEGRRRSPNGGL